MSSGTIDPYAVVTWNGQEIGRTNVINKTNHPTWMNQVIILTLKQEESDYLGKNILEIVVYSAHQRKAIRSLNSKSRPSASLPIPIGAPSLSELDTDCLGRVLITGDALTDMFTQCDSIEGSSKPLDIGKESNQKQDFIFDLSDPGASPSPSPSHGQNPSGSLGKIAFGLMKCGLPVPLFEDIKKSLGLVWSTAGSPYFEVEVMSTSLIKSPGARSTSKSLTFKMKGKLSEIAAISHPPHCVLQWGSEEIGSTGSATSAPSPIAVHPSTEYQGATHLRDATSSKKHKDKSFKMINDVATSPVPTKSSMDEQEGSSSNW